jgi:Dehydrogenases with different specificities (related to short-chain alcohol dehydrogenases)
MTGNLTGRTALVTGAGQNLGLAIAAEFAHQGANVVLHARRRDQAAAAAATLGEGPSVRPIGFDLGDPAAIAAGFAELDAAEVLVDSLVLNAAHLGLHDLPTIDQPLEFFDEVMQVNLIGVHRCSMLAASRLIAAGRPGSITVISSLAGERAIHGRLAYNTSKAAVDGLVRSLALELAPYRIRVNGIAPGYVWSDRWTSISAEEAASRRALIPAGAETAQSEIAQLAAFLATDAAPTVIGQRIVIDGGLAAQQSPPPGWATPSDPAGGRS